MGPGVHRHSLLPLSCPISRHSQSLLFNSIDRDVQLLYQFVSYISFKRFQYRNVSNVNGFAVYEMNEVRYVRSRLKRYHQARKIGILMYRRHSLPDIVCLLKGIFQILKKSMKLFKRKLAIDHPVVRYIKAAGLFADSIFMNQVTLACGLLYAD